MNNRYYASLAASDSDLAEKIRSEHQRWFKTIETALGQVIQGLNDFSEFKGRPHGELESARLFLATRTFRSLHMSISVLERGYYQQALGLVRMAMEDMLVAEDVEVCPKTLELLLHGDPNDKVRLGRGDLSYGAMSARISPEAAEAWKRTYDAVSVYATHPRSTGLQTLVTWGGKNLPRLSLNPHYDRQQLAVCIELVAKESMNLIKTVVQLLHGTERDWILQAHPAFANLESLIDEVRQEVKLP